MKEKKSLYSHIIIAFIMILIFMFLITSMYFRYARNYLFDLIEKQHIIINVDEDITNNGDVLEQLISGVIETLAIASIIGILLVIIVARHIINPIKKLNNATQRVAKGDFTINLETNRKDEIGELTKNFNKMVKELNSIEYLSKEFMSNISHEFKTPIASIQGFAKLLEDENITEEDKKEYISIIIEESERLANLSSNIQNLSKIENKKFFNKDEKIILDEQIRKCIIILNQKVEDKNIDISMNDKNITILGNEDLLQQVWINLINNAIKYNNENGKIEVILDENKDYAIVEIKDNGIGIEKEKQERIFEKFYQVDKSHSTEGSGLGLAIVKEILDLHGAEIILDSEYGKGTSVKVLLPKQV